MLSTFAADGVRINDKHAHINPPSSSSEKPRRDFLKSEMEEPRVGIQHRLYFGSLKLITKTLFVGNLPFDASDDLLKQWVRTHGFEVDAAEIIRDRLTQHSRGNRVRSSRH
jgi:hypothetical protein